MREALATDCVVLVLVGARGGLVSTFGNLALNDSAFEDSALDHPEGAPSGVPESAPDNEHADRSTTPSAAVSDGIKPAPAEAALAHFDEEGTKSGKPKVPCPEPLAAPCR